MQALRPDILEKKATTSYTLRHVDNNLRKFVICQKASPYVLPGISRVMNYSIPPGAILDNTSRVGPFWLIFRRFLIDITTLDKVDRPVPSVLPYAPNSLVVHEWASILPGHIDLRPGLSIRLEALCGAFYVVKQKGEMKYYENTAKDHNW